jgi:hypothetical protein
MKHPDPEQVLRVNSEAIEWLRGLTLTGPEEDVSAAQNAIDWLEDLNVDTLNSAARDALDEFTYVYHQARGIAGPHGDRDAVAFVCRVMLIMLIAAKAHAERDDDTEHVQSEISRDEFRQRHIAPIRAESRRLVRVLRRRYRVPHGRVRGARGCGHRRARRSGTKRAAGIRAGTDPGDDGEHAGLHGRDYRLGGRVVK